MSSEDPRTLLRRLFRLREPEIGPPPADLEAAIMARHAARHVAPRRRGLWAFVGDHRWAIAGAALAVGACRLPVDYQRSFGASVECRADPASLEEAALHTMTEALRERIAAENVSIRVMLDDEGLGQVRLDVWGDLEDADEALAHVRELAPALADAECEAAEIEGTVHGTLGGRLGRFIDVDIDRRGAAEAREAILAELAAQGFRGHAEVEVEDDGQGQRRVKIRLEEKLELPAEGELPEGSGARLLLEEEREEGRVERRLIRREPGDE